jgi:hypothetical protein
MVGQSPASSVFCIPNGQDPYFIRTYIAIVSGGGINKAGQMGKWKKSQWQLQFCSKPVIESRIPRNFTKLQTYRTSKR